MRSSPITRTLLTLAGIALILGPVLYASDHTLTPRLTIVFIACWVLAAACLLAGNPRPVDDHPIENGHLDNG